jgi:hypothetical protein
MFRTHNIPLLTELDSICRLSAINISLLTKLREHPTITQLSLS